MRWFAIGTLMVLLTGTVAGAQEPPTQLRPPQNVKAEPASPQSSQLSTRSAIAEMNGDPQNAIKLADQAIRANPRDPWPYYDKGMALARIGQVDQAVETFVAAEQRFSGDDRWGKSIAIYGRAHALDQAGRCEQAKQAFYEYASLVKEDAKSADMARRHAGDCKPLAGPPAATRR